MMSLRELNLCNCGLRAVPAFVGELSGLTYLDIGGNFELGNAPVDRAFSALLGRKLESLHFLNLGACGLRAVPAFVGGLESLEIPNLSCSFNELSTTLDILIRGAARACTRSG